MDSDPPPPLASSRHQGKSDNNPQSHAILHLKPSIRQTVVKTITTTTIHYAPIALPRPKSPLLNGDYATDRHSLPLQLAEKRRKEALLRGGRVKTASSDAEEENAQDDGDLRRFQLEFGGSTGGDTDSASNREPIKATYSLDGHTDATVASISTLSQASIAPDRKGKGKARQVSVDHSTHSGLALQEIPELKRKRCASQLSESAQPGPSTSTVSTVPDTSSSVPESSHPPRKKTRTSSTTFVPPLTRARASSGTTTHSLLSQATTSSDSDAEASIMKASRTAKGKGRAIPSEIVLPSPTLSPGLPADESREEESIRAVNTERQLVSYSARVPTPESQELVSTTSVEQVLEDDEKNNNDEQQLACLAEGHTLSTLISLPSLIDNYSTLSPKLQLNILYQLLRQSSTPILQRINQIIQPALKRDFISDLPIELSLQIMFYLDHKTIINCLTVCRNWKRFIDSQGKIWLNLLKEKNLWIGNGEENAREEIGFDNAGEDDERESGIGNGNKKKWTAFETIENEEASFWEGVGTTKGAFRSSKVGRKLHRQQQQQAASIRERRRRKSTSKSRSREREDDSVENGEGSRQAEEQRKIREDNRELDVKDLLSISDWKAALFLKRWKEGIWDEGFDMEEAARPTAEKLAALSTIRSTSPASGAGMSTAPAQPHPRLRRANTRPRIGEDGALRRTTSPPSAAQSLPSKADYVHPLKLIYKKRTAVRSHWFSQEPVETSIKRITFQSSQTSVITNLQFDNEKIITSSDDPIIDIYDTLNGELKMRLKGHDGGVWALQYIGNVLVSGSTDRTVRVWDLETGNCTHVFYGHTSTVRCLQIVEPVNVNPDPNGPPVWEPPYPLIVTGSRDWTLRVWRLPYPTRTSSLLPYCPPSPSDEGNDPANNAYHLRVLRGHGLAVRALAAHGRTLVSGSYDSYLRVWDILSGECKHKLVGHGAKVYSVALDTARNRCASGSMDGSVRIWSLDTGESLFRLDGHSSLVGLLGCSYHYLVSAGADSTLKVWDPNTGTCIDTLAANAGAITCFKHDDFRIVSGCEGQLRVWDIRSGQVIKDVVQNMQGVWQLQFSDRFAVAAVSRDGRTDFEILDFFPELRDDNKPFWSEFEDAPEEKYDSMDEDMQEEDYEVYDAVIGPDDEEQPSLPHYEVSTSQTSLYQTPRQGMSSTSRQQPPTRKHLDGRIYSYPDGMLKKHHHHHHHHRHHHHHSSNTSRSNVTTSRASRTTILRPDQASSNRSRNASNTGSAISSVLVGGEEEENVDDLFAYDAGIHAGPSTSTYHPQEVYDSTSNTIHQEGTEQYQDEWHPETTFAHPGLIDEQNYQVKSETPDVKAEEEDPDETYM